MSYSYAGAPVTYTSSHHNGGGVYPQYGYSDPMQQPGVVYTTSSRRSRHHRHHGHHDQYAQPTVVTGTVVSSGGHHHRSRRHHHSSGGGGYSYSGLTLGERIRRFFGFRPRNYRHKSSNSSWGFLGRSRPRRYIDARTGGEVDRKGRPVYRV